MNELQRQHYLSALGIDTYMPRWQLPFAPESVVCDVSHLTDESLAIPSDVKMEPLARQTELNAPSQKKIEVSDEAPTDNLLNNIFDVKKASSPKHQLISAADILAQLDSKPTNIDAFSLSIWRPIDGVMIVDSRNSKLALPTELLLNNILRSFFLNQPLNSKEEILRWPMIENSFTKRTADDARVELQTWLSVQHEIRPIRYLWLMGQNAASYLVPEPIDLTDSIFQSATLFDSSARALILPSLNETLQNPAVKQKIFAALRHFHSSAL